MVDDLRPVLGSYGFPDVKSPNIDQLAANGIQFNRAYCNIPVCGASRASLFTGLRPNYPKRFNNYLTRADEDAPDIITLPEFFKNNGYTTISNGKVLHHWEYNAEAWSETPYRPEKQDTISTLQKNYHEASSMKYINPRTGNGPYFEASEVPDSFHIDGSMCLKAIKDITIFFVIKPSLFFYFILKFYILHLVNNPSY